MFLCVRSYYSFLTSIMALYSFCMPMQVSAQRNIPVGWSIAATAGVIGGVVGVYKLAAAKVRLKKIRAELAKKPRSVKLQVDEENAYQGVLVGSTVLTLAGILALVSAYKVRAAVSESGAAGGSTADLPVVKPKPGGPDYKETREGYDSQGNLIPGWALPQSSSSNSSNNLAKRSNDIYYNFSTGLWYSSDTHKPLPDDQQKRSAEEFWLTRVPA